MSCVFCEIRDGESPSFKVYEDEYTLAFLDINPVSDGHVLLITKEHVKYIEELREETAQSLMKTLLKIISPINRAMKSTDNNIIINNGPNAGQIIPHLHIHIIPKPTKDEIIHSVNRINLHKKDYFKLIAEKIQREITSSDNFIPE
jgi:histidine triad (HIT) family protein